MNIYDLIPKELKEETAAKLLQICQSKTVDTYPSQRISKSGEILDVWVTATPLVNESMEVYAIATTERVIKD
jgi:two-component system CheB/CheR fusion protein